MAILVAIIFEAMKAISITVLLSYFGVAFSFKTVLVVGFIMLIGATKLTITRS